MVWLPNLGSALVSWLSRLVVVSAASVVFGVSAMCNVLDQNLDTIADFPAVFVIFATFDICYETQLTNTNSEACK